MKKRLLSALLALALVFVLLPTTALAGETTGSDYDISINGTNYVFSDSETCYFKSSFTSTEPSSPYLKLTKNSNTITVTVSGYVTVSDINVHNNFSTQDKINLIITGNKGSTLNIECKDTYGAALETYQSGDITIKGGITVNANFSADNTDKYTDCYGIRASKNLIITGKGTTVNAVNADDAAAVKVDGNITVSDGAQLKATNKYSKKVTNYTGNAYAIECGGQLSISGDKTQVTADTSNGKKAISGTVNNGDKLTFKAANYKGSEIFLQRPMDEALGYKYVEITQAPTDPYVFIAGEPAIMGQETPIPGGSGTYLYVDAGYDGNILTLNNVTITSGTNAIQLMADGTYTINLVGTNTISDVSAGIVASNLYGANDITAVLSGTGSLDISAKGLAINMKKGDLKFENTGAIKLATSSIGLNNNALSVKGNITITDMSKYSVTGTQQTGGKPLGSEVSLTEASQLKGGTTGYRIITITPAALEESTAVVAGTKLYKNTAYTIQNGKPVIGGTYPSNYNIYLDTTGSNYVLYVNNADIKAPYKGISGTSNIIFEGTNSITAGTYGIYSDFSSSDLNISGTGSLTINTTGYPAIATDKMSIAIGGSLDVTATTTTEDITADKNGIAVDSAKNLTISDTAKLFATSSYVNSSAIRVGNASKNTTGDLTVNSGATLTATSTSDKKPTVQVGGNATFTGSTVTITNHSTALHKDAADKIKGDSVSSALYVKGNINTDNAKVTAKVENGGGNAIGALGNITVKGSSNVTAVNKGQKFTTIIAKYVYVSGDSKITANNLNKNPPYNGSYLAFPAIEGSIVNQNTDYSLMFVGKRNGSSEPETTLAPGEKTTLYYYNVTITRGDEVTRTNSPVVIDGHTLLNDTYYTINGSTVAEGTENNYNAFYDSETKTLKLNNAQISHSFAHEYGDGTDGAIIFKEYKNYCIELSGTNTISSMNTYAINGDTNSLTIKNADGAENAKLTLTGNWTAICSTEGLNIQSDVTMVNTKRADHLMYVNGTFSFDGYNAYASVNASGSPLVEYTVPTSGDKDAGYQYLRITKETLETGGGSTHQHTYDQSAWKSDATHHWQECTDPNCPDPTKGITNKAPHSFSNGACTVCGYRGQTEEHHFSTDWTYDETHHWHACTDDGCTAIKDKAPHEWTGWRIDEPSPGMHNRFCNCGYNDYSHHYNLVYAAAGEAGHYQYCTLGNCTFKTSTVPHNYDGDTCTICNYTKSGEIVPPTPDNPGTIVIIRPAEEEKPAQQPNPSTGANDLVGLAVAAAVAAALGSAALLRKHD